MNKNFVPFINTLIKIITILIVVAIPLFFWNLTTEFYEMPKLIFLIASTLILLILWIVRFVLEGKMTVVKTHFDLPLILILLVFLISFFFSSSRSIAIFGNFPRVNNGLIAFSSYILLYFALASNLKKAKLTSLINYLLVTIGVILSVLSLFSYFGINILPFSWTTALNFTPAGSSFSTTAILALILAFPLVGLLNEDENKISDKKDQAKKSGLKSPAALLHSLKSVNLKSNLSKISFNKILYTGVLILFTTTIALTGSLATFIAGLTVFVLVLFAGSPTAIKKNLLFIILPLIAALVVIIPSYISVGGSSNILYTQAQAFPREVQLPLGTSWKVAVSAFRDSPFWGTGPGSFLFDFTTYKPMEFNNSKFWAVRFDQAFNEYLGFLATLGALGVISLLLLTIIAVSLAFKSLAAPKNSTNTALAISTIVFFVLLALHSSTLPLWSIGVIILALFTTTYKKANDEIEVDVVPASKNSPRFDTLPIAVLAIVFVIAGTVSYYMIKFVNADLHHRNALSMVSQNKALDAYGELVKAENLNPYIDLYRTDLAQTNFALANALASSKTTEMGTSFSEQDKQNIQTLLSQAINEGKAAVTISPNSPANWEVLGSIYRQVAGVAQNALAFSLDSYGKAIQKDPVNPMLRLTVGGIYYSAKNYDMAIRFFTDTINLKPDYANGYYNLAMALKEKGDIKGAIAATEKTISLLDPKNADYKTAAEFLANLKSGAASDSTKQAEIPATPDTLQKESTSSALQKKNLPKVLNLPKPDKIATPPAVKKTQE